MSFQKRTIFKREDISTAEIAKERELLKKRIQNLLKILYLRNVTVKEIMTPYSVMVTADENLTINQFYENNPELVFSRIPILNDQKIEAYVLKDTILESIINNKGNFKCLTSTANNYFK